MAIDTLKIRLIGITPLLMHSGQTADPLNEFTRAMGKISSKKKKTEEDYLEISNLEWWAGLYLNKMPTIMAPSQVIPVDGSKVIMPAHLLDSNIREGARKNRAGKEASAGCVVDEDGIFDYDGPSDLNELFRTPKFHHRANVKVKMSRVMRTRPIFDEWSCTYSVTIDTTVIQADHVIDALHAAGKMCGLGDWRPGAPRGGSFGRFEVKVL